MMKRLILTVSAILSCVGSAPVAAMSNNLPTPTRQILYNLAGLGTSLFVYKVTNDRLHKDQKAREIEIAKKNIEDGFRDSIKQAEEFYQEEAKRQLAQRFYGVRMPSEEELKQQVAEDRMLADAYRREQYEKAQREPAEQAAAAEADFPTEEQDDLFAEPDVDKMSGDDEQASYDQGDEEAVLEDQEGDDEAARDEQLAEYTAQEEEAVAPAPAEKPEPAELDVLPKWKRLTLKGVRAMSIASAVFFVAQLVVSGKRWVSHYRGKQTKSIKGGNDTTSLSCSVDAPSQAHYWFRLAQKLFPDIKEFYCKPDAKKLGEMKEKGLGDHSIESLVAGGFSKEFIAAAEAAFLEAKLRKFSIPKAGDGTDDNPYKRDGEAWERNAAAIYQSVRDRAHQEMQHAADLQQNDPACRFFDGMGATILSDARVSWLMHWRGKFMKSWLVRFPKWLKSFFVTPATNPTA